MVARLELDTDLAECGGAVTGIVMWRDLDPVPRQVFVELLYRTEGRGDEDRTVVDQVVLPGEASASHSFRLRVPHVGPISYDGRLIRVLWEVQARMDVRMKRDPVSTVALGILPQGGIVLWQRHTDPAIGAGPPAGSPVPGPEESPFEPPGPNPQPPPPPRGPGEGTSP